MVLLTCTYVPISSLVHKIALFLSRKTIYIGYYLNRPPFRNDSMDQHNLQILLLYLYYQIIYRVLVRFKTLFGRDHLESKKSAEMENADILKRSFEVQVVRWYFSASFSLLIRFGCPLFIFFNSPADRYHRFDEQTFAEKCDEAVINVIILRKPDAFPVC